MLWFNIAKSFYFSKKHGALSHFMSIASTIGIALGCFALIVGLSALNGFEKELYNRVLNIIPTASAYNPLGFNDIDKRLEELEKNQYVLAASKVFQIQGVIANKQKYVPILMIGIDPNDPKKALSIDNFVNVPLSTLEADNSIILGKGALKKINAKVGDKINLYISKSNGDNTVFTNLSFTIVGIIDLGGDFDANSALISYSNAQKITNIHTDNLIYIKSDKILNIKSYLNDIYQSIKAPAIMKTWIDTQGKLYNDIMLVKSILYIAMLLVIAVASFNIVSTLVMTCAEKSREIAIIKTIGGSKALIIKIFCTLGILNALIGTLIGLVLGSIVSLYLTQITSFIEYVFNIKILDENLYYISFIPTQLHISDIISVFVCTIIMSILASLYPAIKASKLNPILNLNS